MNKIFVYNTKGNILANNLSKYVKLFANVNNENVVICPSSIFIPFFLKRGYSVGIQDVSLENNNVSAFQASSMGVKYSLIKNDFYTNDKINDCIKNNIIPILLIGESIEEKRLMKTEKILKNQLVSSLRNIEDLSKIIICYNPSWDIVTYKKDLIEIIDFIKRIVELNFNYSDIKIICNINTIKDIENINVDGYLTSSNDFSFIKSILEVIL